MVQVMGSDLRATEGVSRIEWCGYSNAVCLSNAEVRVIVDPNVNGRVLDYSWRGTNVIMTDPKRTLLTAGYQSWIEKSYETGMILMDKKTMRVTVE